MNRQSIGFIALCLGFFMVMVDVTIVNVALPNIANELSGTVSGLQWVVNAYTLAFACLLLSSGSLADKLGAKSLFLFGTVLFIISSLFCGLANGITTLTLCRIVQGAAAAMTIPSSLTLINSMFNNPSDRAKAIGIWGGIGGIAAAFGPILGASLTALFNWRAVFFVNIPFGFIGIYYTYRYVSVVIEKKSSNFDVTGQLLGIIAIATLAFSLIQAGELGWLNPWIILSLSISAISLVLFVIQERRTLHPMFPMHFFTNEAFSISIVIGMILNIGFYGELFLLPLYFHNELGYSILLTGLATLPQPGLASIASYLGGKSASKAGPIAPIKIGLAIGSCGFLTLFLTIHWELSYWYMLLPLAAIGFGTAYTMPAATISTIRSVPDGNAGLAAGAFNTTRQVGSLLGVSIFGTIIALSNHFTYGMQCTLIIAAILFVLGIALATQIKE